MKKIIISILMLCAGLHNICVAEDADLTGVDNVIYVASAEATQGSVITLSICMKNTAPIRGFQFDLYLPEGVTAVKNDKGRYVCSLNPVRLPVDDEHTLTLAEQQGGCIRFLCGTLYDENFTGNIGEIATLSVAIDDDMPIGEYPIVIKNVKLTETDIRRYYETEITETTLTINDGESKVNVAKGDTGTDVYYDLQGRCVSDEQVGKGIYIKNGKKVVRN